MADHRRAAAPASPASPASPAIPPPPPPPPPKVKTRSYFERFVALQSAAYTARPPTAQPHRPHGAPLNPLVPRLLGTRSASSLDATHKTGLDIAALDVNRERTHAVLAGKDMLKTVRVDGSKIVDDTNLRAAVLNYADPTPRQRDGLGIQDVKWSHGLFASHIATAVANGKVILYDLNRASVELVRLHEHSRQVHKLSFNPHQGHLLLSASHDATVRLWDLRDVRHKPAAACTSRDQFAGISGGIRDVQWSPTDAVEFAFGTDNGTIQRWDFRHNKGPKQKIPAHDQKTCTSIDWHPDGKHLLSAGVDRSVKIWDFSVDGRRQKPAYVLTVPYPVHRARWRPPYWSDELHDKGAFQCTQLATSYDRDHPVIHVWDVRRPHLPYREINRFRSPPSDMLWQTRDTLWTVGREGIFQQNDVHHAPKLTDRRPLQAVAISSSGELTAVAQQRLRPRRPAGFSYDNEDDAYLGPDKHGSLDKSSLRSSADNSFDESHLASSSTKRHHGRTASNRSARSFGSTPPSDVTPKVMFLPDSMTTQSEQFHPDQLAIRGALPGAVNVQIFAYLAQKYKAQSLPDRPVLESYLDLEQPFQQNAEYAQRAAYHRLAQTWTLVGTTMATATKRRAEQHRSLRLKDKKAKFEDPHNTSGQLHAHKPLGAPQNPAVRAILGTLDRARPASPLSKPAAPFESTSNLATPLARPVNTSSTSLADMRRPELPDPDHDDKIHLPPSVMEIPQPRQGQTSAPPLQPRSNGSHWYDSPEGLEERRAAAGSWRASPRIPLNLNPTPTRNNNPIVPPPFERHDSGESFTMFSASTDSQHGSSVSGSFESANSDGLSTGWQHAPDKSSFGKPTSAPNIDQETVMSPSANEPPHAIPVPEPSQARHDNLHPSQDDSGHLMPPSSTERVNQEMNALRRTNQFMRHDSSESSAYASSHEGTSFSSTYSADMEASGTIVPDVFDDPKTSQTPKPPVTSPVLTKSVSQSTVPTKETQLLLADFQALKIDAEGDSAFTVVGLLNSILHYHTDTLSDAQFPSLLLLLLAPLLPQTHSPSDASEIDVAEVLSAFSDTFTALGLTPTQARAILSTQLGELIATGINPYQAESILHAYHAQMHSLSLFNSAASLRRLAYPTYPAVYEQALKDTQLGLLCLSCKSPINNPKDKMRCESCRRAQAPCPVCWGKFPAFEPITAKRKPKPKHRDEKGHKRKRSSLIVTAAPTPDDPDHGLSPSMPEKWAPTPATLWTWCPLCGHGGHSNCLSTWFADATLSEGACPTEGCLCDCVSGKRREEKMEDLLRKKADKERSKPVKKGNDWRVRESRAVSAVRGTFGESGSGTQPPSPATSQHRPRSQTPSGAHRADGRKVRVLAPPPPADATAPHPAASST